MAKKETLTDDGKLEEVEMEDVKEAAKDDNKKLGFPAIDDEDGRDDKENDEIEGGTKKTDGGLKTKKSNASAKAEGKAKKEEDDEDEDDEEEGDVEEGKSKKEGKPPWLDKDKDDDDEDDDDKDESKAKKEEKEIEVDVSEDVSALIDGEELSEDFKTKAATIFEAAVKSKIAKIRKQVREESKKDMEEKTESIQKEMTEKMDEYMNYVVKEWMEENKLAVEQGVRNEVTESFISGLKKLFEEHYIDVPAEKEDVFESLVQEVAELETKLDEQTQKHMDNVKELNTYKAKDAFRDIVEGMVDTDIEKMKELTEDVDYETDEQYKEKLNIIKNSYFKSEKKLDKDNKATAATNKDVTDGTSDSRMDSVMAAISNLKK
jgi:chemotaxis protein histidine kinase CheA